MYDDLENGLYVPADWALGPVYDPPFYECLCPVRAADANVDSRFLTTHIEMDCGAQLGRYVQFNVIAGYLRNPIYLEDSISLFAAATWTQLTISSCYLRSALPATAHAVAFEIRHGTVTPSAWCVTAHFQKLGPLEDRTS